MGTGALRRRPRWEKQLRDDSLSVITMLFTLGTAISLLIAGYLISFGYVIPFAFGAVLAGFGALLVYSQVEETLTTRSEAPGGATVARVKINSSLGCHCRVRPASPVDCFELVLTRTLGWKVSVWATPLGHNRYSRLGAIPRQRDGIASNSSGFISRRTVVRIHLPLCRCSHRSRITHRHHR